MACGYADRFTAERRGQVALAVTLILTVKRVKGANDGPTSSTYLRAL